MVRLSWFNECLGTFAEFYFCYFKGSFATATCTSCKFQVDSEFIRDKIFKQEIPYCDKCKPDIEPDKSKENPTGDETVANKSLGILKPDIVFFGEGLPELYHKSINEDKSKCDLLIVIGSSLKVKPVANIPRNLLAKFNKCTFTVNQKIYLLR